MSEVRAKKALGQHFLTDQGIARSIVDALGADGVRGTLDDISPDPALFEKPFRDTTWTNDWVPYWNRGIIVRPRK